MEVVLTTSHGGKEIGHAEGNGRGHGGREGDGSDGGGELHVDGVFV